VHLFGFAGPLTLVFTALMAVDCVRNGRMNPWLWLILVFPPLGGLAYLVSEYAMPAWGRFRFEHGRVTARDLERAALDVRRLDTAAAWSDYACLLRQRGKHAAALDAARQAASRDPRPRDVRYELGRALLATNQPREALPVLAALAAEDRYHDNGGLLQALARAQESAGDLQAARATLETLIERHSAAENLYAAARAQAAAGDRAAATATLDRLLEEMQFVPKYLRSAARPWARRARALRRKISTT
jgi:hypothetical protein